MDISVVIPTYNRYELLKRAVTSVLDQSYQPKEIVVVDDGSTDGTADIQKDFPNIKYIYKKNGGVSSARNLGVKNSSCEWIAFLDCDDEWLKEKLLYQVEFHKKHKNILMSYTDEIWIRDNKEINIPKKYEKLSKNILQKALSHCFIAPSSILVKKILFDKVGVFDESLEVCEDYDLFNRIALHHEIGLVDKKLILKYGGREDQLSVKFWGMDRFRVKSLEKLLSEAESSEQKDMIVAMLIKKYTLLLKGAAKYDRIADVKRYRQKLREFDGNHK